MVRMDKSYIKRFGASPVLEWPRFRKKTASGSWLDVPRRFGSTLQPFQQKPYQHGIRSKTTKTRSVNIVLQQSRLHSHQVAGMRLDHDPDALAGAKLESVARRQR